MKRPRIAFETIVAVATEVWQVPVAELCGRGAERRVSVPRQVAYWLAVEHGGWSQEKIAAAFDRDHSTVQAGITRVRRRIQTDPDFAALVAGAASALLMAGPAFVVTRVYRLPTLGRATATFQSFEVLR